MSSTIARHIAGLTKDAPSTRPSMHSSVNLSAYEDAEWFEVILNFLIHAVTQARHAGYEWCYVTQFGKCYNMCIYHMSNVQGLCSWRSIKTGPDRFSNFMPPGSVDAVLGPVMTNCNEMCHVFCRQPNYVKVSAIFYSKMPWGVTLWDFPSSLQYYLIVFCGTKCLCMFRAICTCRSCSRLLSGLHVIIVIWHQVTWSWFTACTAKSILPRILLLSPTSNTALGCC